MQYVAPYEANGDLSDHETGMLVGTGKEAFHSLQITPNPTSLPLLRSLSPTTRATKNLPHFLWLPMYAARGLTSVLADPSDHHQLQTTQCHRPAAFHDDVLGLGWCPPRRLQYRVRF